MTMVLICPAASFHVDSIAEDTPLDAKAVVANTLHKQITTVEKYKTKNTASYRSFPLMPEIRELFLDLKQQETTNREIFGDSYAENDYIFKWSDGRPFAPDFVTQKFSKLFKQHGLPHIRFHELRHSCASNLIAMGFGLKDVQEWLGHADIQMTANTYSHLDVTRKQAMAEKLGATFGNQ